MFIRIKDTIVDTDAIASMYLGLRHGYSIGIVLKNMEENGIIQISFGDAKEATDCFDKIQQKLNVETIA